MLGSSVSAYGWASAKESNHALSFAPNLLKHDFATGETASVSSISCIRTRQGRAFLLESKIYSREIVGFTLFDFMDAGLVLAALITAVCTAHLGDSCCVRIAAASITALLTMKNSHLVYSVQTTITVIVKPHP